MNNIDYSRIAYKVPPKGISWMAIFAGTVAALSVMLILNLIGLAIGFWSFNPTEAGNPMSGLGTGSIIWWVISNLIVLFIGGFIAARVGVSFSRTNGVIHGVMTWALYALVSAWILTSAIGSIVSGVGNIVGGVLSTPGQVVADQVGPMISDQFQDVEWSLDDARAELYSLLEDTGKESLDPQYLESQVEKSTTDARQEAREDLTSRRYRPGRADATVEGIFSKTRNRFEQSFEAIDKQALVNVLVERTDMNEAEARRSVDNVVAEFERAREDFEATMQQARQTAVEQAENIAGIAGDAAMYLALALILGALAAAFGGFVGVNNLRKYYIDKDFPSNDSPLDRTVTDRTVADRTFADRAVADRPVR